MKHYHILEVARSAAHLAADQDLLSENTSDHLYRYARERKYPTAETLARKFGEMIGRPFPFARLADAPEHVRIGFTLFREIVAALDPWYEAQDAGLPPPAPASIDPFAAPDGVAPVARPQLADILAYLEIGTADELQTMARLGLSLKEAIAIATEDGRLERWTASYDEAEIVTYLLLMRDEQRRARLAAEEHLETMRARVTELERQIEAARKESRMDGKEDDVEARTKTGQAEMEKIIAAVQFPPQPERPAGDADAPKPKKK